VRRFAYKQLLASHAVRLDLAWEVAEPEPTASGLARADELTAEIAAAAGAGGDHEAAALVDGEGSSPMTQRSRSASSRIAVALSPGASTTNS